MAILIYTHDPMCSWCYGFSNTFKKLLELLPAEIQIQRLLGGLAPDTEAPMSREMIDHVRSNWQRIEQQIPHVSFNYDFWTNCRPRRATYQACRAVIAARSQGAQYDVLMTEAIQRAYYQQASNPSDRATLIDIATEVGLDPVSFTDSLDSQATQQILLDEIATAKELGATSFPNLKLRIDSAVWPIAINYSDPEEMADLIQMLQ